MTEPMQDHWWWRPGWAPGRRMLTFHLTFFDATSVCSTADAYRHALGPIGIFDDVPDAWLHLTLQDVAFLDEITGADIDRLCDAVQDAASEQRPFDIEFLPAQTGTEGVFLPVAESRQLAELRSLLRRSIVDTGREPLGEDDGFWPHLSVAYCHATAPAEPVIDAVNGVGRGSTHATVSRVDLIALSRDEHVYEWLPVASLPLLG